MSTRGLFQWHMSLSVYAFLRDHLTPCLDVHRPHFFLQIIADDKGRQRQRCAWAQPDRVPRN